MKTIYCIPGLGATDAIFSRLKPKSVDLKPLKLPRPTDGDDIHSYASRLLGQLDTERPFWLLGQSFGGMLAIEMSRLCSPEKIILVSSVKCRQELPWYARLIGALRLHRLVPYSHPEYTLPVSRFLNGISTADERAVLKEMVAKRDVDLLKWSTDQAVTWHSGVAPDNLFHIHGTADRLIPARYVHADAWIVGGTHFMIVSRAEEISRLLDRMTVQECD